MFSVDVGRVSLRLNFKKKGSQQKIAIGVREWFLHVKYIFWQILSIGQIWDSDHISRLKDEGFLGQGKGFLETLPKKSAAAVNLANLP